MIKCPELFINIHKAKRAIDSNVGSMSAKPGIKKIELTKKCYPQNYRGRRFSE
jgi:hypothetical protein